MSINLVSLLAQYVTPEMIGRVSSALGVDRSLVGKGLTLLAPTLLRMLAGVAATPLGAQRLASAVEKQDPGILGALESAIGSPHQDSIIKEGVGALESLLGGSAVSGLAGVLSKFTGIGESPVSSLIGLAAPAVLGVLNKEKAAQGLDASGLAHLLDSQKANISEAIPPEFGKLLSAAGLPGFPSVSPADRPTPIPAKVDPAVEAPEGAFNWRLALAALAAVALASYFYFGNRTTQVVETPKPTPGQVVQNLSVDGVNLTASVKSTLDELKTALQGVNDKASAEAALPQLEKSATEFDKLRDLAGKLPFDAKTSFALVVSQLRPSIEEIFNKVLAIPGVAAVAKPVIDGLRAKLDTLSESKA